MKQIKEINDLIISIKNLGYKTGAISDTYHTFNELYDHRTILFLALLKEVGDRAWYSLKHDDGTMFDDMFIAGMKTNDGMITYHIENKYLPLFQKYIKEIPNAPKWDGYTSDDVLYRLVGMDDAEVMKSIIDKRYD